MIRTGRWWILGSLAVCAWGAGLAETARGQATPPRGSHRVGVMPRVTPDQFVEKGVALVEAWRPEGFAAAKNRAAMVQAVENLFQRYFAFTDEVAEIYPAEGLEWLLITDEVCDSIAVALIGPLDAYEAAHPQEVLTQGRQAFELELMKIVGPPARMLGFHVVRLGSFHAEKVRALHVPEVTDDYDGLADGFLRHLRDWCHDYEEVHDTQLDIYQSRISQQDWIISRLRDECGNVGKWKIKNQYMAMFRADSTKTPPEDLFAHEFHLVGTRCEEERIILIDLPNFLEMQEEVSGGEAIGIPTDPLPR